MKKRNSLLILFSILFTLFLASNVESITSCTINFPVAMQTNDDSLIINSSAEWAGIGNVTNVTYWRDTTIIGTNSTTNGTRTTTTTGDYTHGFDLSGLSQGAYAIRAECRNNTLTSYITEASSLNSSAVTLVIDRTPPSCSISILTTEIEPLGFFEIDCSRTTDTNTINNSARNSFIKNAYGTKVSKTSTSGINSYDGSDTEVEGSYTASCNATDNAGNTGSCKTEEFEVRAEDGVVTPAEKIAKSKQFVTPKKSYLTVSLIIVGILLVIVIILVAIYFSKKRR